MKKLIFIILLFMLPFSVNAADVYYCSENETIGFDPKNNYKTLNYKVDKFKILIDFENENVVSNVAISLVPHAISIAPNSEGQASYMV